MNISIVIPCYNYGHLVERAIKSVCSQSFDGVELIVVNDGSTDDSFQVLEELKKRYDFELYDKPNGGLSSTRNFGVEKAMGDYLVFLDADDELVEGGLRDVVNFIIKNPKFELVILRHMSVFESGKEEVSAINELGSTNEESFHKYLSKKISLVNGGVLMHRTIFKEIIYNTELRNSEDSPVFSQSLALFNATVFDSVFIKIYKHSDSMRHDLDAILATGLKVVDETFNGKILPEHLMKYKRKYTSLRSLSISRAMFRGGRGEDGRRFYHSAINSDILSLTKLSYLKKYLRSYIKC